MHSVNPPRLGTQVTGGRNGYGAKLCNIFSTKFIVETGDKATSKRYRQVCCAFSCTRKVRP